MPIRHMMTGATFTPEEVQVLVAAFEGCCNDLGVKPRDDTIGKMVAKTVVQVGKFGATNSADIQKQVLLLLRGSR